MILNLGCGQKLIKDAINVDVTSYPGVDQVVDLSVFPWHWADNSVDGIHSSHFIEHLPDQKQFLDECYRILKPGGFLRLCVPHSSNCVSIGCMGHYRTYSYNTFNDYMARDFYMFKTARYKTVEQRLNWWFEYVCWDSNVPKPILAIIVMVNPIINFLINLSPPIFENLWWPWVGGAREVIWKGVKI